METNNRLSLRGCIRNALPIFFMLTMILIVFLNTFKISLPILEEHSFRQTQTALTAYYLKLDGFKFGYETPVVGEPWSIPFEFPIYQWIVANISSYTDIQLTVAGRIVNLFFVILCCVPIWRGLKLLNIKEEAIYCSLILFLTAPTYLFWAGTFMIEGAALFFSLAFLYYAVKILKGFYSLQCYLLLSLFLLLASLQKITTVLPVVMVLCPFLISSLLFQKNTSAINYYKELIKFGIAILIPIGIAVIWITYTDQIKSQNLIGMKLTSASLSQWNYGTLSQRLSTDFWDGLILYRSIWKSSFSFIGIFIIFYALVFLKNRHLKIIILTSIALFLTPFLLFANLHLIHNYYQTSNVVFLSIAVGISLFYVLEGLFGRDNILLPTILIIISLSNIYYYKQDYYPKKISDISAHRTIVLGNFIKEQTDPSFPVVWIGGYDWSSEVAFYSERKSLTVPPWSGFEFEAIKHTNKFLSKQPSAFVLCPSPNFDGLIKEMRLTYPSFKLKELSGCHIYLRE